MYNNNELVYFYIATIGQCSMPKLDIIFVLDTSRSMGNETNFEIMKNLVKNTAGLIEITFKKV